jgi:hypothetical protein
MYKWTVIDSESNLSPIYIEKMETVFQNLPRRVFKNANHIAVFDGDEIIGGVTLESFPSLVDDADIVRDWMIELNRPATRILRFWGAKVNLASLLFEAIWKTVPVETLVYGILSVPYSMVKPDTAITAALAIAKDRNWLQPKLRVSESPWAIDSVPSSEGKRLLSAYLKMGAKPLGAPSACVHDQSIKIVLGAFHQEVKLYRECYDKANS